jgi:hypothetical protein
LVGDQPRHDIGRRARPERRDDAHGLRWPALRLRRQGDGGEHQKSQDDPLEHWRHFGGFLVSLYLCAAFRAPEAVF